MKAKKKEKEELKGKKKIAASQSPGLSPIDHPIKPNGHVPIIQLSQKQKSTSFDVELSNDGHSDNEYRENTECSASRSPPPSTNERTYDEQQLSDPFNTLNRSDSASRNTRIMTIEHNIHHLLHKTSQKTSFFKWCGC